MVQAASGFRTVDPFAMPTPPETPGGPRTWVRLAFGIRPPIGKSGGTKEAYSATLRGLGEASAYLPDGRLSWGVPGLPKHLQGMLAGGMLGGGFGYGAGWLGEKLLPEDWQRKRLRRTLAILGGALGAAPGLAVAGLGAGRGKGVLDDAPLQGPPDHISSYVSTLPNGQANPAYHPDMPYVPRHEWSKANAALDIPVPEIVKRAFTGSQSGWELPPAIDVDEL